MTLIKCENLSLGYEGKEVIKNINLTVNEGDYLCVVGENGSGKTTLLKGLLGFIKPYGGKIEISSYRVGYLPQQTTTQKDFPVSVREVILSGCLAKHKLNPFYTKNDKLSAEKAAQKLEISKLMDKCYQELSGGQKQRVLLARALCATGNLIILDEPVQGLDPMITNELYDIIYKLNRIDSIAIIMISHDIKASLKYASHILHIGNDFSFFGTREDYLATKDAKAFTGGDING